MLRSRLSLGPSGMFVLSHREASDKRELCGQVSGGRRIVKISLL